MRVWLITSNYRNVLRELIDEKFKSRQRFCEVSGIDPAHLSRVIKGTKELSLEKFLVVMRALGVELVAVDPQE